jgi:hypothetical protein
MGLARFGRSPRWVPAAAAALVLVAAGAGGAIAMSSGGRHVHGVAGTIPAAKVLAVEHAQPQAAPESTIPAPVPAGVFDRIPASVTPASAAPIPVSPQLVRVANVYLVSDGRTLVAVYAGAAGDDAATGRFVIVRQNLAAGTQSQRVVDVPGAGAVTIVSAPHGAAAETSGQTSVLQFRGLRGAAGTLSLASGRAAVTTR